MFGNGDLAAGGSLGSLNPVHVYAGDIDVVSESNTYEGGQTIKQYTVMARNAAGNLVPWDKAAVDTTNEIVGIAAQPITTAAATPANGPTFVGGFFNFEILVKPAGTTLLDMKKALDGRILQVGVLTG
jgi:hypothetical protein